MAPYNFSAAEVPQSVVEEVGGLNSIEPAHTSHIVENILRYLTGDGVNKEALAAEVGTFASMAGMELDRAQAVAKVLLNILKASFRAGLTSAQVRSDFHQLTASTEVTDIIGQLWTRHVKPAEPEEPGTEPKTTPQAEAASKPAAPPKPPAAPKPAVSAKPALASKPVTGPKPTAAPKPVSAPRPATAPEPTSAPRPATAPEPASMSEPVASPEPAAGSEPASARTEAPAVSSDTITDQLGGLSLESEPGAAFDRLQGLDWSFGVTAASSDASRVGSTFVRLRLEVAPAAGGPPTTRRLQLSVAQFYSLLHQLEKARALAALG